MKNVRFFYLKIFSFWWWNFQYIWIGICFRNVFNGNFFQPMKICDCWVFSFIWELFLTKLKHKRSKLQSVYVAWDWKHSYWPSKKISKLQSIYVPWDWKLAFLMLSVRMPPVCFPKQTKMSRNVPNQKIQIKISKSCQHASKLFLKKCQRI